LTRDLLKSILNVLECMSEWIYQSREKDYFRILDASFPCIHADIEDVDTIKLIVLKILCLLPDDEMLLDCMDSWMDCYSLVKSKRGNEQACMVLDAEGNKMNFYYVDMSLLAKSLEFRYRFLQSLNLLLNEEP